MKGGEIMVDLSKLTESQLKDAIFLSKRCGIVPVGGYQVKWYEDELERRTGSRKGWHEV